MESNRDQNSCHQGQRDGGLKHGLLMILCCMIPLALALTLKYLGYGTVASYLVILLCPLMHFLMMRQRPNKETHEGR